MVSPATPPDYGPAWRPSAHRGGHRPIRPGLDLHVTGALLPGPTAALAGPTFTEWLDSPPPREAPPVFQPPLGPPPGVLPPPTVRPPHPPDVLLGSSRQQLTFSGLTLPLGEGGYRCHEKPVQHRRHPRCRPTGRVPVLPWTVDAAASTDDRHLPDRPRLLRRQCGPAL